MFRVLFLLSACLLSLVSCEEDVISIVKELEHKVRAEEKVEIINYQFSPDCKYLYVDIRQNTDLSPFVLNDTNRVKIDVSLARETLLGNPAERNTWLAGLRQVGSESVDSLKMKMLVLVDLTLPQDVIDKEYYTVKEIRNLFAHQNLYVSFITPHCVTKAEPVTDYLMEQGFSETTGENYLYRSISSAIRELTDTAGIFAASDYKVLLILSDTRVYRDNAPIDPEYYTIQEELIDQVRQLSGSHNTTIFYAHFAHAGAPTDIAAINKMKLICKLSDGAYTENFDWPTMKRQILGRFNINIPDFRAELINADGTVFNGSGNRLRFEFKNAKNDTLLAKAEKSIHVGNVFNPIIVNGRSSASIILQGCVDVFVLIAIIFFIFQYIIPFIRYRLFLKKYVTCYTSSQMVFNNHPIGEKCYYCKAPFRLGDEIVVKCEHTMHKECWDENGQHCPEHGRHCKTGSHYYNRANLSDAKNASFYMKWTIMSLIAGLVAWMIFTIQVRSFAAHILELFFQFMYDIKPTDEGYQNKLTDFGSNFYQLPSFGLCISFTTTFFLSMLSVFRKKYLYFYLECLVRGIVAGIGGWLSFVLVAALSIAMNLAEHSFLLQWMPWPLTGCVIAICVTWRTRIRFRKYWILISLVLGLISMGLWSIFYIDSLIDFRGAVLISHLVFSLGMGLSIAKEAPRSEHYFLHAEGAIKPMDIAIYKWLANNEDSSITIGKSVDCNLQMSWDIGSAIAPQQAEIRYHKGRLCLFTLEEGVMAEGSMLPADYRLPLYHGTSFTIGLTTFTYLEKDV